MESKMFTKELIEKPVETVTGRDIGILKDFVIDTETAKIKYLLVASEGSVMNTSQKIDDKGRLVIETDRLRVENNKIIIN
ncbi:MAG: PRC-barrel domain-containing protein [Candidatus Methanomethylophilaceae archaeon]|nr:PRC-barrel domain-containing protein [Candidatus Methanomethylophilaceae archaeon]MDD3378878.1 PRC-barrel domain-containing protein [Candidatus Methanomethylophilaceae archaeon]MDY0223983.1 PRC-barrel domain-containing protein [Candidatus Methanomethylophilaceae archaeon]